MDDDKVRKARRNQLPSNEALDRIPVEELIQAARAMEARLREASEATRRRLEMDLRDEAIVQSGLRIDNAPLPIQKFLSGEIDLDSELSRRFNNAPLLSSAVFRPRDAGEPATRSSATLASQDGAASVTFEIIAGEGSPTTEVVFDLMSMVALRFNLRGLTETDRRRWLDLMRREDREGSTAFLWSAARWQSDYLIFVMREYHVRLYAFSPQRHEAAARLTRPVANQLINWLDARWFPGG
ncbi:MAG: hypothetical protein Kow00120_28250 [Anaerolineae bacterium]